ncbi:hypothetical protein BDV96DRAFT_643978 [Lophiotrema nucula]|uniref:Uncharacterized protein n=1 Tax=Lophiotrema nucula TaxID=690887 RepID=A0A6A5ZDP8_9PLEO|nr:hypothetical protein BDV96DRAFT_643978 [Lophiotrema nucula]
MEEYAQYGEAPTSSPLAPPYTSMLPSEYRHNVLSTHQYLPRIWHPPIAPIPFKVYYLPDGRSIPQWSIVHIQKKNEGFYRHPVLVVDIDDRYVHFYSMTRQPPHAIAELGMCLRVGTSSQEEGLNILRLRVGSQRMHHETWINLEQRFRIEKHLLRHWSHDVTIAESEWVKLRWKVEFLEGQQNRFIYKPIARDLSQVRPGTIVLMPNPRGSATLGAPVVVLENQYPHFRFLRVKSMAENIIFQEPRSPQQARARQNCLAITPTLQYGHEGTPVMVLEPRSPNLREKSYIEINRKPNWSRLDKCQTWCWPPVKIQSHSIKVLRNYMARLPPPIAGPMPRTQGRNGWESRPQWNRMSIDYRYTTVAGPQNGNSHLGINPMYGDIYGYTHDGYNYNDYDVHMAVHSYSYEQAHHIDWISSRESSAEPVGIHP